MLEGCTVNVPERGGRKGSKSDCVSIDTTNILFLCGGAFTGLDELVAARSRGSAIGFDAPLSRGGAEGEARRGGGGGGRSEGADEGEPAGGAGKPAAGPPRVEDLLSYGFLPEFVGRFPVMTALQVGTHAAAPHPLPLCSTPLRTRSNSLATRYSAC